MAFLASFLRTLTLAFAALHFLDPAPLGKGPRAGRVDARQCATRGKERAARAALWQCTKANTWARLTSFYKGIKAELARRSRCWAAAPDLMPGLCCFLRAELPLAPTAEEKSLARFRIGRTIGRTEKIPRDMRDAVIRTMRNEDHARTIARASQLSPDYEAATTEVWRHIRATPRGAPNTTDVRAWARQVGMWGP